MKSLLLLTATLLGALISFTASADWVRCAGEMSSANFSGQTSVRYGADGRWETRNARNGIRCNNANFGDPAPGRVKACYIWSNDEDSFGGSSASGWTRCAGEGEFCGFSGRAQVRYGVRNQWETRNARNGVFCGNEVFGDPAPGRVKSCYLRSDNGSANEDDDHAPSGWVRCAWENEQCHFSGTREVRYGARGRWASQIRSGGTFCGNIVFGDPAPDIPKACYIQR